jgi:hypothetical protein
MTMAVLYIHYFVEENSYNKKIILKKNPVQILNGRRHEAKQSIGHHPLLAIRL